MKNTTLLTATLIVVVAVCIAAGSATAMSRGWAIPLEIGGGYVAGIGASAIGFSVAGGGLDGSLMGNFYGLLTMIVVYPTASTAGIYGVGELAEGDSVSDIKSFGYTLGASALTTGISLALPVMGPALAIILTPLVGTLTYNLVKEVEPSAEVHNAATYTPLISFSVGF